MLTALAVACMYFTLVGSAEPRDVDGRDIKAAYDILHEADRAGIFEFENKSDVDLWLSKVTPGNRVARLEVSEYFFLNDSLLQKSMRSYGVEGSGNFFTQEIVSWDGETRFFLVRLRVWRG